MKQLRQQQGFTMIELIMVIVILGVLSAFALPRFADLGGSARAAAVEGLGGNIKSAMGISRAAYLAGGGSGATVELDGVNVDISNGYPAATTGTTIDVSGMITAAGLANNGNTDIASYVDGDFTYTYVDAGVINIYHTTAGTAVTSGDLGTAAAIIAALDCGILYDVRTTAPQVYVDSECD